MNRCESVGHGVRGVCRAQMSSYKGEKKPKYVPHSELAGLKAGNSSKYYDSEATLMHMANSMDMHWEQRAGFNYDGAFAQLDISR